MCIKNGFENGIKHFRPQIEMYFCSKTTSLDILFLMVFRTFGLRTSLPISPLMSNLRTKASYAASRPITVHATFSMPFIIMMKTSPPLRSTILTNSRLCNFLRLHGMMLTQPPFEIAGEKPTSYPQSMHLPVQLSPLSPFHSHSQHTPS